MAKTLNPMATPYQKHSQIPTATHEMCVYKSPQPAAIITPRFHFHFHHNQIVQQPPTVIYTFNMLHYPSPFPSPRKPPQLSLLPSPPPSPVTKPNRTSANIPVPAGPRIPKSRLPEGRRKLKKFAVRSETRVGGGGGQDLVWRPKLTEKKPKIVAGSGRKQRWKNQTGGYFQMLPMEDNTTTVVIKNIPNKYTRELLIQTLDNHCRNENSKLKNDQGSVKAENDFLSAYDFLYLPIDFKNRVNAGFAFVNFTNPQAALRFRDSFHGRHWEFFGSPKIAEISRARIQGKESLLNNCKIMDFTYGSDEDKPVMFNPARDGSGRIISKMHTLGKSLRAIKMRVS